MKTAMWIIGTTLILAACAGPAAQKPTTFPIRIQNRAQAEKLEKGSALAVACAKCQNLNVATVDEKKRFLSWFSPYEKHGRARCGGKLIARPSSASGYSQMIHTCTRCGNDSAFTCAAHSFHTRQL